jgi:NAD(P)-dependent dehydrogenase (short-subunit alcohol dehydrogenase family)
VALNPKITDWRGKRVWLVGASTGIGAALVAPLLAAGARVAVSARSADKLKALTKGQADALALSFDVTDHAATLKARDVIVKAWGGVDVALFIAGTYAPLRADAFDLAVVKHHFSVNFDGVLHGIDAVLPDMVKRGAGSIGIVSSVAGYRGLPRALAYGPSKAALINLAETLYIDLHERGIGIFLINPGFVETPLTAQNDFKMPALITPEVAAKEILQGMAAGEFEIHFPKRFTRAVKAASLLPYRAYFPTIKKSTGM